MRTRTLVILATLAFAGCKFAELPPVGASDGSVDATDADLRVPQRLTVSVNGDGTVASEPQGIDCNPTCTHDFDPLTSVTLTATPGPSSVFEGWSGDCSGTTTCQVTMDGAKNVTALFRAHGAVRWVKQIGFSGDETSFKIVVDSQNNVIAAGTVDDGGGFDLFVIKYRGDDGEVVWMRHLDTPDPNGELFGDVAVDADGNVYVGTRLQGNLTPVSYDGHTAMGDAFGNIVVLRLAAATGTVEWAKQWGGGAVDYPSALTVVGPDLFVAGYTSSGPSTFDGLSISATTNDAFVVRANAATGTAAQLKLLDGASEVYGLAAGGGHLAVVGAVRGTTSFDGACNVNVSGVGNDAMIFDLTSSNLTCQWARANGDTTSNNDAYVNGVAAVPGGGWVLTGYFEGGLQGTGAGGMVSRGLFDVFTLRMSADGQPSWAYRYGDTGSEVGRRVATTAAGAIVLAGDFTGSLILGTETVTGVINAFVTRMSSGTTPIHEWAVSLGGNDADRTEDIALGADGTVYVLASFNGMTTVGGTALSSQATDVWVAALVR